MERPDYRRLHSGALFTEYMRLLESGRIRFLSQLKELQENPAEERSAQTHEVSVQSIPVETVTFEHTEGAHRAEGGRVVAPIRLHLQVPSSASRPLTLDQKTNLRIVVLGVDQSGSVSIVAPATDVVELDILVVQERTMPLEEVPMDSGHDLAHGSRSRPRTNPQFLGAVEKGVEAREQWLKKRNARQPW